MSYETEMVETLTNYDFKASRVIVIGHIDLRKKPMSKLPIRLKMDRAIHDKLSFNNLGSNTCTRIRWHGDYYIVSSRVWNWDIEDNCQKWVDVDFAVGRLGKVPFMFRSPYAFDPTSKKTRIWLYNEKTGKTMLRIENCDLAESYRNAYTNRFIRRLDQLQCVIFKIRTAIGTRINPKTGRKNKIVVSVPCLRVSSITDHEFDIGNNIWDQIREEWDGKPRLTPEIKDNIYYGNGEEDDDDEASDFSFRDDMKYIPLLKAGWYYRNGQLALETTEPTIEL